MGIGDRLRALAGGMARGWPGRGPVALAAGLGLGMAAGQAPLGFWWLTVPALAGVMALVSRRRSGGWWLGWFAGAGYFAASLSWIYEPFLVDAETYGWMAPFAVLLMAFGLGLFWGLAGWAAQRMRHPLPGLAVTLALVELARGYVLTGFPWALIGHVWVGTPVAQAAALIGPVGLTLVTTLAAAGLSRLRPVPALAGLAALALPFAYGLWALSQPDPAPTGRVLRLVQPNAEQSLKWDPVAARRYFERQLEFTAAPGEGGRRPDLVIWPETAMPYLLERSPEVAGMIAGAGAGVPVMLGLQRLDGQTGYNSLAVIGAGGVVEGRYDKAHLVPFGEYVPAGDLMWTWFGIGAFASQMGAGYTPGAGPETLLLPEGLGRTLPLICYEAVFPQDLRAAQLAGRADWIVQITNDAWFGTLTGPWQHLAQARLRAIEQGLPLARAANTGISAIIDARGRVLRELPLGQAGWIDVALPGALPETLYARTGDWPVAGLLLFLGVAAFLPRRRPVAGA